MNFYSTIFTQNDRPKGEKKAAWYFWLTEEKWRRNRRGKGGRDKGRWAKTGDTRNSKWRDISERKMGILILRNFRKFAFLPYLHSWQSQFLQPHEKLIIHTWGITTNQKKGNSKPNNHEEVSWICPTAAGICKWCFNILIMSKYYIYKNISLPKTL